MPRTLREIQELIVSELISSKRLSDDVRELFRSAPDSEADSIDRRFEAYRRNFLGSRLKALAETFPRTLHLVGEKYFRQMGRGFARATISRSADLGEYGAEFPDFIRSEILIRTEAQIVPYLADIAAMEWAVYRASRRPDVIPNGILFSHVAPEALAPTATSRLILNSAFELLRSQYPLLDIWESALNVNSEVMLGEEPHDVVVWRSFGVVQYACASSAEVWLLEQFKKGELIEEIIEKAPRDVHPESLIPELIKKGLVIGYY